MRLAVKMTFETFFWMQFFEKQTFFLVPRKLFLFSFIANFCLNYSKAFSTVFGFSYPFWRILSGCWCCEERSRFWCSRSKASFSVWGRGGEFPMLKGYSSLVDCISWKEKEKHKHYYYKRYNAFQLLNWL